MTTIIHERDFILIKNMLSSDDRLKLILLKEKDLCTHITCSTYTQSFHRKQDLTDILTDIYAKFIEIIKTEGSKYQQKYMRGHNKIF
jgi:predicted nucleic acid-binding Zn finger protein